MTPRILIVGTVPYNRKSTSRAFQAYFQGWERSCLAQIFSNTKTPCKGHCESLYQITDHVLLRRWFCRKTDVGHIFQYDDLPEEWVDNTLEVTSRVTRKAYKVGGRHTPLTHLLRGLLWRKKYWCTKKLNDWLDSFSPDCVFLSFSDDYFILQIALYVAERYNIPIVSSIGDDYYFNKHFSLSPIYQLYKETYKALVRKVLAHKGSAIYISDKIRDKYNSEFGLDGETIYLTSEITRRDFRPINTEQPIITYFGNIRMGRNDSLCEIADALREINMAYAIDVYSNENDSKYYRALEAHSNIRFHGSIPYSQVQKEMCKSDVTIIVEGFRPEHVELSRYSLSTKAADALASGCAIVTYGSPECGVIEYMQSTSASAVCTKKEHLISTIKVLFRDQNLQKTQYKQAVKITAEHHNLESSCATFRSIVEKALRKE